MPFTAGILVFGVASFIVGLMLYLKWNSFQRSGLGLKEVLLWCLYYSDTLETRGGIGMTALFVYLDGPAVHQITVDTRCTELSTTPEKGMILYGLDKHFRFDPYGMSVRTTVRHTNQETREEVDVDAWVSFPYYTVTSVVERDLLPYEQKKYDELRGVSIIGFQTPDTANEG